MAIPVKSAMSAVEKKRKNSIYHLWRPGLKTNKRFMIQQNTFAITNPIPVAKAARQARVESEIFTTIDLESMLK